MDEAHNLIGAISDMYSVSLSLGTVCLYLYIYIYIYVCVIYIDIYRHIL